MVNLKKKSSSVKGKDFEEVKLKVGKAKPGAVNATDTSFQSKRLCLRQQDLSTSQKIATFAKDASIARDSLLAVLRPTMAHCGHYNVNMRKDAFSTILKKCREVPGGVSEVLGMVMEAVCKGIVDQEPVVRTMVIGLLTWLHESQKDNLTPFYPSLMQYVALACTHIQDDIRRDALKFINICMKSPILVAPHVKLLLNALADSSKLKTRQVSGKGKASSVGEVALDLVEVYNKARRIPEHSEAIFYKWQPVQNATLRSVMMRKRAISATSVEGLSDIDFKKITSWICLGMADDWLEAAPMITNPHITLRQKSTERMSYDRLINSLTKLREFAGAAGYDEHDVMVNMPSVMLRRGNNSFNPFSLLV